MSAPSHPPLSRRFSALRLSAAALFFCACLTAPGGGAFAQTYAEGFSGSSGDAAGGAATPVSPQSGFHGSSGDTAVKPAAAPVTDPAKTFANEPANAPPSGSQTPPAASAAAGNNAATGSAAQPASDVPAPPPDPCAAFMGSYNDYVMCQDRYQKIERMRNAQKQRDSAYQAPVPAAPAAQPAPAATDKKADSGLPPNKFSGAYQQEQAKKEAAEAQAKKDAAAADGTGTDGNPDSANGATGATPAP